MYFIENCKKYISNSVLQLVEVIGILLLFVAMGSIISLISYSPDDPSLNTAIDGSTSNLLSFVGSCYSDIVMQCLGSASYILSFVVFSFGYQLIQYHVVEFYKVICGISACLFASVSISFLSSNILSPGLAGELLSSFLSKKIAFLNYNSLLSCVVFSTISLICLIVAVGLKKTSLPNLINSFYSSGYFSEHNENSSDVLHSSDTLHKSNVKNVGKRVKSKKDSEVVGFVLPPIDLLKEAPSIGEKVSENELKNRSDNLIHVLNDFGIDGEITGVNPGPVVTLYELKPAAGIKSSRVVGLSSDIARYMSAVSARVAVIPGRNALGIELPNAKRQTVYLRELLESTAYNKSQAALPISLGKDISGKPVVVDLALMPHLLIAGTTGSGKSVGINAMILSLLYKLTPDECKFIMIDPKMLELSVYDDIPHLLTPVVTDPKKAVVALKWAVKEMESRYMKMSKMGVRNIEGYNTKLANLKKSGETMTRRVHTGFDPETGSPIYETQAMQFDPIPYIVIVVDEMADLMLVAGKDIEITVQRLAQMARAAGIHLIMATQRPSVDVITGTIKANFPSRISFHVSSKIDSRTILGEQGAEQLLGQGDMLYLASGGRMARIHCPFVSDIEVEKITQNLKMQGEPHYITDVLDEDGECESQQDPASGDDPLYQEAVSLILREGKASTSFIQRHLKIGYNRAARIIDMMEAAGIVSPANHVGKREILSR